MFARKLLGGFAVLILLAGVSQSEEKKGAMTEQQKRGHELFLHSQKGTACSTCHALAGEGTAVGPDLTNLVGVATPEGVRMAIMSTQTVYVQAVKLTAGSTFPGMKISEDASAVQYYDLSKTPPERRAVDKKDLDSAGPNSVWKHPPGSADYTSEELADVISYLRYIAKGDRSTVKLQ